MKKIILILIIIQTSLWADNVNIRQVDSSSLMFNQNVDLYVQITDDRGQPIEGLKSEDFIIKEYNENKSSNELEVVDIKEGINNKNGINFLLLVDNSGSMYRTIDNKLTSYIEDRRISIAKQAIKNFVLNSVDQNDMVSLSSFNTLYTKHSNNLNSEGLKVLDEIQMPGADNKTELYSSLIESINFFGDKKGRKVVIVLSDGENIPYGKDRKITKYQEVIDEFQKDGITIFAINFAGNADKNLKEIGNRTGGFVLNANNQNELNSIYTSIKNQISTEYLISYKATMIPGENRFVSVTLGDSEPVTRRYFSSTIFGQPLNKLGWILLISTLISISIIYLLWKTKFDQTNTIPNIEILDPAPGVTVANTKVFLNNESTIIGSSYSADLTIAGSCDVTNNHALIVFDDDKKNYRVSSKNDVMVNNRPTKDRVLESGDVINIAGTTIVFDD